MKQVKTINFITGTSGSGKNEVLSILNKKIDNSKFVKSYTTRKPREKEIQGQDYNFITKELFDCYKSESKFLECVEYEGVGYGHLSEDIVSKIDTNNHFNLIIEPNGIYLTLKWFKENPIGIELTNKYDIEFNILHVKTKKSIRIKRLINDTINKNDSYDVDFEKTNKIIARIQRDNDDIDSLLIYLLDNYMLQMQPSLKYREIFNNDTFITLTTKYLSETIDKSNDINFYNIP